MEDELGRDGEGKVVGQRAPSAQPTKHSEGQETFGGFSEK